MKSILQTSLLALSTVNVASAWFKPAPKTTWQYVLERDVGSLTLPVDVYIIDLFTNDASVIKTLHDNGKKVICYFSAGTYEPNRPDSKNLTSVPADIGTSLAPDWPDENWLNIRSQHIIDIMKARIDTAYTKGCDGLDPDNLDAYDNGGGGFKLTEADSQTYLSTLATYAHAKGTKGGLSIGLKNAGSIVAQVVDFLDYAVNEQCVEHKECNLWQPFIKKNKAVFHVEYKNKAPDVHDDCFGADTTGFSTIIKASDTSLPAAIEFCPAS